MSKKVNKKEPKDESKNKPKQSYGYGKIIFFTISVIGAIASIYLYNVTSTPSPIPVPKVDSDYHWASYPINLQQDVSIRPFKVEFTEVVINDLRERLLHRRPFAPPLTGTGSSYGFNTNFLTTILDFWQTKYNFREREQFLNQYNHFITNIQGLDVHYVHMKPHVTPKQTLIPILLLHGWPGSFREFYELIPKLTTHQPGYKFVFEVIVPSLPGFGFSEAASQPGLSASSLAVIMHNLMQRIGHKHYYVHGGGWGHTIGSNMATFFPDSVLGFHTNTPFAFNSAGVAYTVAGAFWPSLVVEPEFVSRMYPLKEKITQFLEESGHLHLQATKPDTIGIALTDSPAGLASYILSLFSTWTNPQNIEAADGKLLDRFSLTHLLDNIMIYWATNSITTSMRIYAETFSKKELALHLDEIPTEVPTWGIKFKHTSLFQSDMILKLKYKNYLQSTVVDDGGYFAAMENPEILANDIFEAVQEFSIFHGVDLKRGKRKSVQQEKPPEITSIYNFTVRDINGNDVKLDKYRGHVVIIVNVASECGLTDTNYKQLNELYEKYSVTRGLRILAFPCNQFQGQEPGTLKDILKFTKDRGVKFDLFEKVEVNGDNAHPLWKYLKSVQGGTLGDFIKWNFSKFIIDRNGIPVARLGPNVNPLDMEPELVKYW